MRNYKMKALIVLPHLDDEFALVPIIKQILSYSGDNIRFIFCAERKNCAIMQRKRRAENIKALELLGCRREQVIYLNDHFPVDDLRLIDASDEIYSFIRQFVVANNFKQIITLNLEGGHPDHDSLALIVGKLSDNDKSLRTFFVPAYNNRRTNVIPLSVFRPLEAQKSFFIKESHSLFIWIDALKIAFIYTSERSAFIKLLPFIAYNAFFSRSIYVSEKIDIESVDWSESLSLKRYSVSKQDIMKKIEEL